MSNTFTVRAKKFLPTTEFLASYDAQEFHKKRWDAQRRTNGMCERCGGPAIPGHLHHTFYESGLLAYEYPDDTLRYVCEECHEVMDCLRKRLNRAQGGLTPDQLDEVLGFIEGMGLRQNRDESLEVLNFRWLIGVAKAWNIKPPEKLELAIRFPKSAGMWRTISGRQLEILAAPTDWDSEEYE